MNKKVVVFYPSKITGGAEFLLKTVVEVLKDRHQVILVDIEDGWLSNNINEIEKLFIKENSKILLDKDTVLITSANLIRNLDIYFSGNFKILGWIMHPFNVIPIFPKLGSIQFKSFLRFLIKYTLLNSEYKYYKKLIKYLIQTNSLYIMDQSCNEVFFDYYGYKFNDYLPVVISDNKFSNQKNIKKSFKDEITCIWLGRLDGDFKTPILNHVLKDIDKYSKTQNIKIKFKIIGNGPGLNDTKELSNSLKNIEIIFLLEKKGEELKNEILDSNIGFAMGTSALEIASCMVPVVLLDGSYGKVPTTYTYRWLFEEKGHNLGFIIDHYKSSKFSNRKTIEDIMNTLINSREELSLQSYNYVKENHSSELLYSKLISYINVTTSDFNYMSNLNFFKKPYWKIIKNILFKKRAK